MHSVLEGLGFKQSYSDAFIYILSKGNVCIILPVFMDDMTFASKSLSAIEDIISQLCQHFKLHDLGPTMQLLDIETTQVYHLPFPTSLLPRCPSTVWHG